VLQTHLGFLVQGPYRTTPSRDNVPRNDPWNQHLVKETATLLVEALRSLRDLGFLDVNALCSLPLDATKFGEGQMFTPLFNAVREALSAEALLPRFGGGHASAKSIKLARTQDLRELVSPAQLGVLFGEGSDAFWLSEEITQDRTPELRQYLLRELGIAEVTPESFLPRLNKTFLEAQPDEWVSRLYEFLNGQPSLRRRLDDLPLIRLEDGMHVASHSNGQPQAFLPSEIETGFPTVRRAVCSADGAREFLQSLGLTEPDPVDDVVWNVLPKYSASEVDVGDAGYEADMHRILTAFGTDSKTQRENLLKALRESFFVKAVDAGGGAKRWAKPDDVYLATERLKELFASVSGALLVDDGYKCLRGEEVRELLEACGAARYLKPVAVEPDFTWEELREMRRTAGHEDTSGINDRFEDWTLVGIDSLLAVLPTLPADEARKKAEVLWEALGDVETRRVQSFFSGNYRWTHYGSYLCEFPSAFVRQLSDAAWVPDANGNLQRPEFVVFDTLGWKPNPFLVSKVRFKPPIIETLAREAGIEPGVLTLLKNLGLTSEAELKARLGIKEGVSEPEKKEPPDDLGPGSTSNRTLSEKDDKGTRSRSSEEEGGSREGAGTAAADVQEGATGKAGSEKRRKSTTTAGERQFISYVAVRPDQEEPDLDGLDQQQRMALEEKAIALILASDPKLKRTPPNNPGFDLFEVGPDREPVRWIEVKAMTGGLLNRPVGLSYTQFECARKHGEAYWLYVVEHADSPEDARIVRIQDPAGMARTFTFDHGWLSVADISDATGSS
jgi:hypothetical protein